MWLPIRLAILTEYRCVTDGQTDILSRHSPRYAYTRRAVKLKFFAASTDVCSLKRSENDRERSSSWRQRYCKSAPEQNSPPPRCWLNLAHILWHHIAHAGGVLTVTDPRTAKREYDIGGILSGAVLVGHPLQVTTCRHVYLVDLVNSSGGRTSGEHVHRRLEHVYRTTATTQHGQRVRLHPVGRQRRNTCSTGAELLAAAGACAALRHARFTRTSFGECWRRRRLVQEAKMSPGMV